MVASPANDAAPAPPAVVPRLELRGARCRYGDRRALDDVSLTVDPGEIVALLGPNGAGKSTLFKAVGGALSLSAGELLLDGAVASGAAAERRAVGIVPQSIALYTRLSVEQNLRAFGALMGVSPGQLATQVEAVLGITDLTDRRRERVDALSGGMQRRVNIGVALMHEPHLLLLDEATVGVDREARARLSEVFATLCARGLGLLLITHDFDEAERVAHRIAILVDGSLRAFGPIAALVEDVFGTDRVVRLELEAGGAPVPAELLPGFEPRGDRVWEGLLAVTPGALDALVDRCRAANLEPREVHLTRPGLRELMAHHTRGAGR